MHAVSECLSQAASLAGAQVLSPAWVLQAQERRPGGGLPRTARTQHAEATSVSGPSPTAVTLHSAFSPGLELRGSLCCNEGGETVTWAGAQDPPSHLQAQRRAAQLARLDRLYSEQFIEHSGPHGQARL